MTDRSARASTRQTRSSSRMSDTAFPSSSGTSKAAIRAACACRSRAGLAPASSPGPTAPSIHGRRNQERPPDRPTQGMSRADRCRFRLAPAQEDIRAGTAPRKARAWKGNAEPDIRKHQIDRASASDREVYVDQFSSHPQSSRPTPRLRAWPPASGARLRGGTIRWYRDRRRRGRTPASGTTQAAGLNGRGHGESVPAPGPPGFLERHARPDDRKARPAPQVGDPLVNRPPRTSRAVGRHAEMAPVDAQAHLPQRAAPPPRVVEPRTTLNPSRRITCVINSPSRCSLIRMCISGQFQ